MLSGQADPGEPLEVPTAALGQTATAQVSTFSLKMVRWSFLLTTQADMLPAETPTTATAKLVTLSDSAVDVLHQVESFEFHCYSESINPDHYKVFNKDWITLAEGKGDDSTHFIGIAIGIDGYCGTSFELSDGVECGADPGGWNVTPNA